MTNNKQFNLKMYSNYGIYNVTVDIFSGKIFRVPDNVAIELFQVDGNLLHVGIPELKGRCVIVHDENYAVLTEIDKPSMHYFKDVFVFPVKKHKTIYFEVSKNACTSIATHFYNKFTKRFYQPNITGKKYWDEVWRKTSNSGSLWIQKKDYVAQQEYYKDWTKFTVYDDPIKRFLRAINDKLGRHDEIASIIPYPKNETLESYVDKMILVAQAQHLNSEFFDQHLVSISLYLKDFIDEITEFVHLKDLDDYMLERFKIKPKRYHKSREQRKRVTYDMLTDRQIERLKEIYKADYLLAEKYKDKFYVPKSAR